MDFYCERINLNFFNEPLNIISNIFFLICSIIIFKRYRKININNEFYIFPICVFLLSFGSSSFHSYPNKFTLLCDIIPIFVFCIFFAFTINKNILKINLTENIFFILIYIFLSLFLPTIVNFDFLNSSQYYLSNFLLLNFYTFILKNNKLIIKILIKSVIFFSIALFFRTIDNFICNFLNIGTHYLWHLFSSILLFYLCQIFVKVQKLK